MSVNRVQALRNSIPRQHWGAVAELVGMADQSKTVESPYSRLIVQAGVAYSNPNAVISLADGTDYDAFSYAENEPLPGATPATLRARICDTNITKTGTPPGDGQFMIYGISMMPMPGSDPILLAHLASFGAVQLMQSGKVLAKLGPLAFVPGAGGITGRGRTYLEPTDAREGRYAEFENQNNGLPSSGNFLALPSPVLWTPGGVSSNITVRLTNCRAFSVTVTDRAAAAAVVPIATVEGTAAVKKFAAPQAAGDLGTFVHLMVRYHCRGVAARGNQ